MRGLLYLFLISCLPFCTTRKELKVTLRPAKETGLLSSTDELLTNPLPPDRVINMIVLQNGMDTFFHTSYSFDPESLGYTQFKAGKIDSTYYEKMRRSLNMPDTFYVLQKFDAEIEFLLGKKKNGDYLIVVDEDNNNSLANDPVHYLPSGTKQKIIIRNLTASLPNGGESFTRQIEVYPINSKKVWISNQSSPLGIGLYSDFYREGKLKVKGQRYKIGVRNLSPKYRFDSINSIIFITEKNNPFDFISTHDVSSIKKIGDSISLKAASVKLTRISTEGNKIFLKPGPPFDAAQSMMNLKFKNLYKNDSTSMSALLKEQDYLIVDFWGSWCLPCIRSFPELRMLYEKLKDKNVGFVGFLYDEATQLKKIDSLINKYKLDWPQGFISREEQNNITDVYHVVSYPTYFLLDHKGKIIFRDFGEDGLFRLQQKLKELSLL